MSILSMARVGAAIGAISSFHDAFIRQYIKVKGSVVLDESNIQKVQIRGSIQNVGGQKLKQFPEGTRIEEAKVLYTQDSLPIDDYQFEENVYFVTVVQRLSNGTDRQYRVVGKTDWVNDYYVYRLVQMRSNNAIPANL